jgi:lysophospholipase L1-like esterase
MKLFKYLILLVFIIGAGIAVWLFYPQYQIYKIKKHEVHVQSKTNYVTYRNYYSHSKGNVLSHLALGDSVIRGYGVADNENLVHQFSTKLGNQIHKQIEFKNEGINGITSGELKELVQQGKFDDEIKKSDIVTINVGGNDILHVADQGEIQNVFHTFNQLQTNFSNNLTEIAARIKSKNANATIVFLELYNPLSPAEPMYSLADELLPKWNLKIYEVANHFPNSLVIETTKAINSKKLNNLSADGIHPNSAGYTAISTQMIYQFNHEYRKA